MGANVAWLKQLWQNRGSLTEWLNFWENLDSPGRIAWLLGGIVVILAGLGLGFVGSQRVQYAKEFYPLRIKADYLEGIAPGTKIRYQGALVVGEVTGIKSDGQNHYIEAKIKKDFHIPTNHSRITLSTWGYFGNRYLNVDIFEPHLQQDFWPPYSTLSMEPAVNSSIILQKAYDYLRAEKGEKSLLEKELLKIRNMSKELAQNPYLRPREVRSIVKDLTGKAYLFFSGMKDMGERFYETVRGLNELSEDLTLALQEGISRIRLATEKLQNLVGYESPSLSARIMHYESDYEELAHFMRYAKMKSEIYKKAPYKLFFE
ncbi:MAG: MCE family protein [Leptospiraceae bacterium]|nr:MCE family protein [Leptospiraceae bacterium]MDW8307703.1 MCE family protein [Leptospiraceae bacterium]